MVPSMQDVSFRLLIARKQSNSVFGNSLKMVNRIEKKAENNIKGKKKIIDIHYFILDNDISI